MLVVQFPISCKFFSLQKSSVASNQGSRECVHRSLSQHLAPLACCSTSFVTDGRSLFPSCHIVVTNLTVVLSAQLSVLIVVTVSWLKIKSLSSHNMLFSMPFSIPFLVDDLKVFVCVLVLFLVLVSRCPCLLLVYQSLGRCGRPFSGRWSRFRQRFFSLCLGPLWSWVVCGPVPFGCRLLNILSLLSLLSKPQQVRSARRYQHHSSVDHAAPTEDLYLRAAVVQQGSSRGASTRQLFSNPARRVLRHLKKCEAS